MSNYNAHAPTTIGNEWVPVVDTSFQLDTVTEDGYTFVIPTSSRIVSGAVYLETTPNAQFVENIVMMNVYPAGKETETGPVRKVIAPINGGDVVFTTVTLANASTVAEALVNPGDGKYVIFNATAPDDSGTIRMFFDVDSIAPTLSGKRILNVDFIYTAAGSPQDQINVEAVLNAKSLATTNNLAFYGDITTQPLDTTALAINRVRLGTTNVFIGGIRSTDDNRRFPWTLRELQRFQSGSTNQLDLRFSTAGFIDTFDSTGVTKIIELDLFYAALEITYCEETRIMYGGKSNSVASPVFGPILAGQNRIMLQTANTHAVSGNVLDPGSYTVTVTAGDAGNVRASSEKPTVSAIRQLYPIAPVDGLTLTRSLTLGGAALTRDTTNVIVPITLHSSSATIAGAHVYQRQVAGPAYGLTLQQTVAPTLALPTLTAPSYPQVRFYARRFGHTEESLTIQDTTSSGSPSASITVNDFDALPEIIDGWREVTLRFSGTAPRFTSTDTAHTCLWYPSSGTLRSAGNQWQILGAQHDAPSSTATVWNQRVCSYFDPNGSVYYLNTGSGTVVTGLADATIIFSQDPPAVTGFAVSSQTQSVSVVDPTCTASTPECMPTGINYLQLTWRAFGISDDFRRTVASGFGTATSGQSWTTVGGSGTDYNVANSVGTVQLSAVNSSRFVVINAITGVNMYVKTALALNQTPTGAAIRSGIVLRYADTSNHYRIELQWETTGEVNLRSILRSGGTDTVLDTVQVLPTYTLGTPINVVGIIRPETGYYYIAGKAWLSTVPEPETWQVEGLDALTINATGLVGIRSITVSGNTNVNPVITVSSYQAYDLDLSYVEIQRLDTVDYAWQTIAQVYDQAATTFNDYEARVGVSSVYRARVANALDFFGSWTTAVTGTATSPGVSGTSGGNSTLIFTSNEQQDGTANLAYTMTWDRSVEESFTYPEADEVVLQRLYQRDFTTAHRPLERGGEQFTRDIIVQNAAVSTGMTQDGFRSLRDLAWEQLSYVCVRDELGDRWLATVLVPSGSVRRNRRLFIAQVRIIEVTDTPAITVIDLP